MRKILSALCLAALLALALLLPRLRAALPPDRHGLVEKKYDGWSGVLQVWLCETWSAGSGLNAWLSPCVAAFERAHPGVYVQIQRVDAAALSALTDGDIPLPDALLFPPGALATPAGLSPLPAFPTLREPLRRAGDFGGACYAVPVAMGGYGWAVNQALAPAGAPFTWEDAAAPLAVVEPTPALRRDAALLGLCAGEYRPQSGGLPAPGGLDLALPTPRTSPTAEPSAAPALPCRLPEGFAFDGDAWRRFTQGEACALLVTAREARQLASRSADGRAPDWQLACPGRPFSDQLLCLGILWREDRGEPMALCRAFADTLLCEDSQRQLSRAGLFSVTDAPSGYAPADGLAAMEEALFSRELVVPCAFGRDWQAACETLAGEYLLGHADARTLWPELAAAVGKTPNIPAVTPWEAG